MKYLTILTFLFFGLVSCNNDDCEDMDCNNGNCVSGICDCEDGFSGVDCSEMLDPVTVRITKIAVLIFPLQNSSGQTWDEGTGSAPDLRYKIDQGPATDGVVGIEITDVQTGPIEWVEGISLAPDETYNFQMFDVDGNQDELMFSFTFLPYEGERTDQLKFKTPSYDVEFDIEYIFQ